MPARPKRSIRPDVESAPQPPQLRLVISAEGIRMAKNEKTSKRAASAASKVMRDKKSSKAAKTAAASALTQARDKKTGKKK